jgi:hypothetical protein
MENFIFSKCHKISRYTAKCTFIYTSKKISDHHLLIFTKLANPEEQYLLKIYAEFVPNSTMNVESKNINSFRPARKVSLSLPPFS